MFSSWIGSRSIGKITWRYFTLVCVILGVRLGHSQDVLTRGYDNSRSGAYTFETKLIPSTVATNFGKLYERNVDGDVQAQVLYARNVSVPGGSPRNLFFVATAKNKLYVFDADSNDPDPSGGVVWSRQINSTRQLIVGPTSAVSEICNETFNGWVGITSTPVIDRGSATLYAVSWRPPLADMNLFTASASGAVQMSGWIGTAMGYHPCTSCLHNMQLLKTEICDTSVGQFTRNLPWMRAAIFWMTRLRYRKFLWEKCSASA